MAVQDNPALPVQVYISQRDIPPYQRAWIWGSVVLLVLLCGLVTGWLLKPERWVIDRRPAGPSVQVTKPVDVQSLLAVQEANNQNLREQITRLEAVLAGDLCGNDALTAVAHIIGAEPAHPAQDSSTASHAVSTPPAPAPEANSDQATPSKHSRPPQ